MNSEIKFDEFPFSYRLAQGSLFLVVIALVTVASRLTRMPPNATKIVIGILCSIALFGMLVATYVVVRYPWLSLVESSDNDYFKRFFPSRHSGIFKFLKILVLLVIAAFLAVFLATTLNDGRIGLGELMLTAYLSVMLVLMVFLAFIYQPERHPTLATFIRASLGFGILLFPIFLPVVILASFRCRRLLDEAADAVAQPLE